mgnify:CR=1 FL=1
MTEIEITKECNEEISCFRTTRDLKYRKNTYDRFEAMWRQVLRHFYAFLFVFSKLYCKYSKDQK